MVFYHTSQMEEYYYFSTDEIRVCKSMCTSQLNCLEDREGGWGREGIRQSRNLLDTPSPLSIAYASTCRMFHTVVDRVG